MIASTSARRIRAFCFAALALAWSFLARLLAAHAAAGLVAPDWYDIAARVFTLFLVLVGFGLLGYLFGKQAHPLEAMGLVPRPGRAREFALGAAIGWAIVLAAVLPVALAGDLYVTFWSTLHQWFLLFIDCAVLLIAALIEEVIFRGYPFQRLIHATSPTAATLLMASFLAILEALSPATPRAGVLVVFLLNWLLCLGYLRTRALWLGWGLHFAWFAATSLLFGLPLQGNWRYTPILQSTGAGPAWLTGSDYGPAGATLTVVVLLAAFWLLLRVTREYAHRYAVDEILPAGIPVDIDAISRRQHAAAMGPAGLSASPAPVQTLVQIGGAGGLPAPRPSAPQDTTDRPPDHDAPD